MVSRNIPAGVGVEPTTPLRPSAGGCITIGSSVYGAKKVRKPPMAEEETPDGCRRDVMLNRTPHYLGIGNGPEFVAHALNNWCRFTLAERLDRIIQHATT